MRGGKRLAPGLGLTRQALHSLASQPSQQPPVRVVFAPITCLPHRRGRHRWSLALWMIQRDSQQHATATGSCPSDSFCRIYKHRGYGRAEVSCLAPSAFELQAHFVTLIEAVDANGERGRHSDNRDSPSTGVARLSTISSSGLSLRYTI